MYPSPKLIYCLYIVHKSVSEVLVPRTFQKYSFYISVPQKITLKNSLRPKGDDYFTEKGDFSSDSQKFVEILVNEKVIFQKRELPGEKNWQEDHQKKVKKIVIRKITHQKSH